MTDNLPAELTPPDDPPSIDDGRGPLGLLAGEGVFPLLVARGARAAGRRVVCAGWAGCAWPELREACDVYSSIPVARLNKWCGYLRRHGVREAIVVGRVPKAIVHDPRSLLHYVPDLRMAKVLWTTFRHDKRAQTFLDAAIRELAQDGVTVIDSTTYCADHITPAGVLTKRQPTDSQREDVRLGWEICRTISRMDVGQAIAIANRDVIAVEALEGTNAMIERAGRLCKFGGWTLIKVANTHVDMRLDVPTIGTTTVEKLAAAGAGCLVLEAGRTMMLERAKVLELAERYKLVIIGYDAATMAAAEASLQASPPADAL